MTLRHGLPERPRLAVAALVVACCLLYGATLCPDLYWFDSAEFVNDAWALDIPHPPGYPLYNLLAHGFIRLGTGTPAARVNALSAATAALGAGAVALALEAAGTGWLLALAGAALLATAPLYWDLAIVAEVYHLELLLVAVALLGLCRLGRGQGEQAPPQPPFWLPLTLGTMLFHRPTTLPLIVAWLWITRRHLGSPLRFFAIGGLGGLPYLHTAWVFFGPDPAHGGVWSFNYFDFPRTPETFVRICTGTLYAGNLGSLPLHELGQEVVGWLALMRDQLGLLVGTLWALWLVTTARSWTRRSPEAAGGGEHPAEAHEDGLGRPLLTVAWAANAGFFLFYNALEKDTMYLPSLLGALGLGLLTARRLLDARGQRVLCLALVGTVVVGLPGTWARVDRSRYHEVRRAVDGVARQLPPRSFFYLTDDLIIHPFMYLKLVDGRRADVVLRIVDGYGPKVEAGIREALATGHRVFSTLFYTEAEFAAVKATFHLTPRGFLYELGLAPPHPMAPVKAVLPGAPVPLRGAGIRPPGESWRRSEMLQVVATWSRPAPGEDPAVAFCWDVPGARSTWIFPIGYQAGSGPSRATSSTAGTDSTSHLTEEYLLKVHWRLPRPSAAAGPLRLAVVGSIRKALADKSLVNTAVRDWEEQSFFKGRTEGFVRCMERGRPAHSWALEPGPTFDWSRLDAGAITLGTRRLREDGEP